MAAVSKDLLQELKEKYPDLSDEAIREIVNKLASSMDTTTREGESEPYSSYDNLLRGAKISSGGKTGVFEGIAMLDFMDQRRERREVRTGNTGSNPELTAVLSRLENMEKREADRLIEERRQRELQPLRNDVLATRQEIQGIRTQLANMGKSPTIKPAEDTHVKEIRDRLDKAEARYEELKDKLSDRERRAWEKRIETLESKPPPEASDLKRVEDALETYDRIIKRKGAGEGGEFDWRTMAISTSGDVIKEGLAAYREMTKEVQKEVVASNSPQVDDVTKRQVLNFALTQIKKGAKTVDVNKASEHLGITSREVYNALEVLNKEGAINTGGTKTAKKDREG